MLVFLEFTGLAAARQGPQNKDSSHYQAWLNREVRHQLVMLPYYTIFDVLSYSVNGNNVTLNGAVTDPVLKSSAVSSVKSIEGVGNVTDNIQVLPVSQNDEQLRRAESRAIYGNASLQRYAVGNVASIHIIVNGGHVTLEGTVASPVELISKWRAHKQILCQESSPSRTTSSWGRILAKRDATSGSSYL